jgi:hypothetical protein
LLINIKDLRFAVKATVLQHATKSLNATLVGENSGRTQKRALLTFAAAHTVFVVSATRGGLEDFETDLI